MHVRIESAVLPLALAITCVHAMPYSRQSGVNFAGENRDNYIFLDFGLPSE